jgi:hypothetical protein
LRVRLPDGREVTVALLRQEKGQEVHLKQQVTQLVEQLRVVVCERRVGDLVCLLDGVRHDRARGLLPVPGTLAPQPLRQTLQIEEGLVQALQLSCLSSSQQSSSTRC